MIGESKIVVLEKFGHCIFALSNGMSLFDAADKHMEAVLADDDPRVASVGSPILPPRHLSGLGNEEDWFYAFSQDLWDTCECSQIRSDKGCDFA